MEQKKNSQKEKDVERLQKKKNRTMQHAGGKKKSR
jgi:hypothetical protein